MPNKKRNIENHAPIGGLEQWAKTIFSHENSPTIALSRFGLKTPRDVALFMASPAGESILAKIAQDIAEKEAIKEHMELEKHELMLRTLKAALFFWYLEDTKEAAAMHRIQEAIEYNKHALSQPDKPYEKTDQKSLKDDSDYYKVTKIEIEQQIVKTTEKEQKLEKDLVSLNEEGLALEKKFALLFSALDTLEAKDIDKQLQALKDMPTHQESLSQDAVLNKEVQVLLKKKLQERHLEELKALNDKSKYLLDEHGVRTTNYKSAHFICKSADFICNTSASSPIIKENGRYFLLKTGQIWDLVKNNPEEKAEAERHFDTNKSELITVRQSVAHQYALEQKFHFERVGIVQQSMTECQQVTRQLNTQLTLLESALKTRKQSLEPKPSTDQLTQAFKQEIQNLRHLVHEKPKQQAQSQENNKIPNPSETRQAQMQWFIKNLLQQKTTSPNEAESLPHQPSLK